MRASADERARLVEDFIRLCEIESPSRDERAIADSVAGTLESLGLAVEEDASGAETGSNAGNLLARVPPPDGGRSVLLCAHLDTVPLAAPVDVARDGGVLRNRADGILGADNKAAVAVILAALRRLLERGTPVGLELLFTTCEERALAGAKAFDTDLLVADFGYVFDHATPIGDVVTAAPTYYSVDGRFRGLAAHAGLHPERGHNAIVAAARALAGLEFGRLDAETTANVGRIEGGSAANVVAERCAVACEARSLDHERASAVATRMVDTMTEAASDGECDVEVIVEELFRGYRLARGSDALRAARAALADAGVEPRSIATGGGSDANVLRARGFDCVNLANGTEGAHQPDERVSVAALGQMLDVTLALAERAAAIET